MRPMWPGESRGDSAGSNCEAPMAIAGEEPGKHGPGAGVAARQHEKRQEAAMERPDASDGDEPFIDEFGPRDVKPRQARSSYQCA